MKKIIFPVAALLALGLVGCSVQEEVTPEQAPEAALTALPGYCAPSTTLPVGDAAGDYGAVEIMHSQSAPLEIRFLFASTSPWYLEELRFLEGTVPLLPSGDVNLAAYAIYPLVPPRSAHDFSWGVSSHTCRNLSAAVLVSRFDFFGNPVETRQAWVKGSAVGNNGYQFTYCNSKCLTAAVNPACQSIMPGYTSSCATLTAAASGGSSVSYLWSNGATTASITVCPSANTTYTVTVTDASGVTATASGDVVVLAAPCGPNKIQICHTPPGGSSNTQCRPASWVYNYLDSNGGLAALVPGASAITLGPCGAPQVPCL